MKYGNLVFEKRDFVVIREYLKGNPFIEDYAHKDILEVLMENMSEAFIHDFEEMPEDVIRLYSKVTVSGESGWRFTFQLVPPLQIDTAHNKISVQSSLGASVIGLSKGDRLKYGLPSDIRSLEIEKVEQAEETNEEPVPEGILNKVLLRRLKNKAPHISINI